MKLLSVTTPVEIFFDASGADPGEVKWVNFHPPFSEAPSFFFFSYPSNIEIIFDFSDIITKIHPPPPHFKMLDPPLHIFSCYIFYPIRTHLNRFKVLYDLYRIILTFMLVPELWLCFIIFHRAKG